MELGLGSYAFRWAVGSDGFRPRAPLTLRGMVDEAAALGCTLLQIADNADLDASDPSGRARLLSHADDVGVRLQVGTSGCTTERLLAQLEIAADLRADIVRVVLDANGTDPTPAEVADTLNFVGPRYEDAGVRIAIENHFRTPSPQIHDLMAAMKTGAVGVCLDTANSIMVGEWPEETIRLLAPYAINVHFKDYAIEPDPLGVGGRLVGRPLGDGWLDVPALLAAVEGADRAVGGKLGVIVEQWAPLEGDEESTLHAERAARETNLARARDILTRQASAGAGPDDEGQSRAG